MLLQSVFSLLLAVPTAVPWAMEFFLCAIAYRIILPVHSSSNSIAHDTAVGTSCISETALCKSIIPSGNLNSSKMRELVLHDRNFALTERLLIITPDSHGGAVG